MNDTIKWMGPYAPQESAFRRWLNSRSFLQQRLIRFCASMLIMVICFPLYYLGLFGSVEGPLHPARLGDRLASMGVSRTHSMAFFLTFLIIAVSWNWIFNLVSLAMGSRLTCTRPNAGGRPCGEPATRGKTKNQKKTVYICTQGHRRADVHFHPVRKGTVSHSIWVIALAFCIIVLISSY